MKRKQVFSTLKSLQSGALQTRSGIFVLSLLSTALILLATQSSALTQLSDSAMENVSGAGLAFAFDDFRYQMEPTSYFGNIGTVPSSTSRTRPTGNVWPTGSTGNTAYKGNYQWIGTTISRGYQPDVNGDKLYDGAYNWGSLYNFSDFVTGPGGTFLSSPTSTATAAAGAPTVYTDMFGQPQTLAYPTAAFGAQGYAEINNPFVIRVHSYTAVGLSGTGAARNWTPGVSDTVLELVGPTHSTPFRWAFWGQVNAYQDDGVTPLVAATSGNDPYGNAGLPAGVTSAPFSTLENQEIIIGSPTSRFRPDGTNPAGDGTGIELGCTGSGTGTTGCGNTQYQIMGPVFRMYQSMGSTNTGATDTTTGNKLSVAGGNNDQTLAMIYLHRLSGDYRFSVNEPTSVLAQGGGTSSSAGYSATGGTPANGSSGGDTGGSSATGWRIPTFDALEGMYFMRVNAYLPMGQMFYQALIVSGAQSSGNYTGDFITELSLLPNNAAAYNDFYGYPNFASTAPTLAQLGCSSLGNCTPTSGIGMGFDRSGMSAPSATGHMQDRYYETHGYVRWGNNFPTAAEMVTELGSGTSGSITNGLVGTGVTGTYGYSTSAANNGVLANTGTTCGGTTAQQCVTYDIVPHTINSSDFFSVYSTNILAPADIGLCGTNRQTHCTQWGDSTGNVTPEVVGTVPVNVTTGTPVGKGTQAQLLSAGGMVFLARNGGSWTVPQNPDLATTTASAQTNTLIFSDWNTKKALTSTAFGGQCIASGWTGSTCGPSNNVTTTLGSATTDGALQGSTFTTTCTPGSPTVHPVCTSAANSRPTVANIRAGYTDANGTAIPGLDNNAKNIMNNNGGASATMQINGINLGSSRVEGMMIQHMIVTTLGAAN